MLRKTLIATELAAMYALYHQPRPDDATFELLVADWGDVLGDVSEIEFLTGMKAAKRVCKFLLVPADVMRQVEQVRRYPTVSEAVLQALPESTRTRDEQCALNLEWAKKIRALCDRKDSRHQGRKDTPLREQLRDLAMMEASAR